MKVIDSVKPLPTDWLCCLLSLLYQTPAGGGRIFDSVIVVIDKKVLDKKISNSIKQMKQTRNVINPAQGIPQQLKACLQSRKSMIITTIPKFPVVHESIAQRKNRRFAVIISEAHSSSSGKTIRQLKSSLSKPVSDDHQKGEGSNYLTVEQPHICYFGFSVSPRSNILKLYEAKNEEGTFESYGYVSMKQKYTGMIYLGCTSSLLYL